MSSAAPPPFPQSQPPLPPGKKSNALQWIIGIVVVVVLGITATCGVVGYLGYRVVNRAKSSGVDKALFEKNPAYAAAKMAITIAPNVETVSSDDEKGTVTIRNKDDGKVMTFKFDAEKKTMVVLDDDGKAATVKLTGEGDKGALEINSADGTLKIGSGAGGELPPWVPAYPGSTPTGTFSASNKEGKQGGYSFKTPDAAAKVLSFYQDKLRSAGFTITTTATTEQGGMVMGEDKANNHVITVTATAESGGTSVALLAINK
jgi:hypothetical protein